jgi:hypothetical protein
VWGQIRQHEGGFGSVRVDPGDIAYVGLSAVQATSFGVARASKIIDCGVQAGLGVGSMEGLVVGSPVGLCIFFCF